MKSSTISRLASALFIVTWLTAHSTSFAAGLAVVDNFTDISGAAFFDVLVQRVGANTITQTGATFGGVTIAGTPASTFGAYSFASTPVSTTDPGNGEGYTVGDSTPPVVLNFSQPLAAFGVSFTHISRIFTMTEFDSPSRLDVYDAVNGGGTHLGSIDSSGTTTSGPSLTDFVALWSTERNIRSAVISRTGSIVGVESRAAVDGYALSLTPVPEPSSILLVGIVMLGVHRITKLSCQRSNQS